jgi:hypothetical protein
MMQYKKRGIEIVALLLLLLSFSSCEYETEKVYIRTVNRDVQPPEITTVDLDLENDTIYLFNGREVTFRFISSDQKINEVVFKVDGEKETVYYSDNGTFLLDYGQMNEGEHTLLLEVITSSGTNSIADILGAEGYVFSKSWILNVYKDYNTRLTTGVRNGCLNFSWEKYPVPDFTEYIIYREKSYNEKIEVGRTKSTEFTDCSYVGEGGRYFVEVLKKDAQLFSWGYAELNAELPLLSYTCNINNESAIKWSKSKYFNAVDIFYLSVNHGINSVWDYVKVRETRDPEDTTWIVPASYLFGDNIDVKLLLVPRNSVIYTPDENYRFDADLDGLAIGFPFKSGPVSANHITQVSSDEFAYILSCDSLIIQSVSQRRKVDRFTYEPSYCSMCRFIDFRVSASGGYLTTYFDCDNKLMLLNTDDLSKHTTYDLKSFSGQNYSPQIPVSDSATGIINTATGGFYMFDFSKSVPLGHYSNGNYGGTGSSISSDGNYVFLTDDSLRLVRFEDSQFTGIWKHSMTDVPKYYAFDGSDPDRLVLWNGSVLSVKKCSDFSDLYSFTLTDGYILNIDYFSNEMLTYSDGHLYVRSFADGTLIKDIPVNIDPANWFYSCLLINHAVICTTGVMYFVR